MKLSSGTNSSSELDDVVATPCRSHDRIDDTLRTWLELGTRARWGIGERSKGALKLSTLEAEGHGTVE